MMEAAQPFQAVCLTAGSQSQKVFPHIQSEGVSFQFMPIVSHPPTKCGHGEPESVS